MTHEQTQQSYQQILALEEEMKTAEAWLPSGRLTEPEIPDSLLLQHDEVAARKGELDQGRMSILV